jgi:hypothetical protein
MMTMRTCVACMGVLAVLSASAAAQSMAVSIAVRETGTNAPLGADGGTNGGIEFVDRDLANVALDGTWQQVSFNFPAATLLAFAGTTANSMFDTQRGALEMIRLRNTLGITDPVRIFIDDLRISYDVQSALFDFEAQALGSQHVFRDPGFSGSTFSNLLPGSTTAVSNAAAHTGGQSLQLDFQFVDADPSRWIRVTTFNTPSGPNPAVDFRGTLSFWMMGTVIPAPSGLALLGLGMMAGLRRRR